MNIETIQHSNNTKKFGDNDFVLLKSKPKNIDKVKSYFKRFTILNSVVIISSVLLSSHIANTLSVEYKLKKQTSMLQNEYKEVQKEQVNLKKQIAFYSSNEGIEKLARERLGFIKEDEIPVKYLEESK